MPAAWMQAYVPESKAFPVASVANGDVHRAPAVGLIVVDPRLLITATSELELYGKPNVM